jgi:hypothetical protein
VSASVRRSRATSPAAAAGESAARDLPPPATAPRRVRTRRELADFQRLMAHALFQPLDRDDRLAPRWRDGRPTSEVAESFVKANARQTAAERLEIYARCYWFRLIGSFYEDCPGLRALLGDRRFDALARAYLARYPSRSFTLRNLCQRLAGFIAEEPVWTAPDTDLAEAIARFEWAQTHAFDAAALPPLEPGALAGVPASRLRLSLQPHLTLLAVGWPVDEYVIAVKQREAQRAELSNVSGAASSAERLKRVRRPAARATFIAVHRYRNRLYYKRLTEAGYRILDALGAGKTLALALARAGTSVTAEEIRESFATWMELGWFCEQPRARRK